MPPAPTMPMMVAERVFELEIVEHLARDHRQDLRQQAEADVMQLVAAGRHERLRPACGRRPRSPRRTACRRRRNRCQDRQHAGERAEADDVDPDQRPDQRIDAADGVEPAARQEMHDRGWRRRCAPPEAERQGEDAPPAACRGRRSPASRPAPADRSGREPTSPGSGGSISTTKSPSCRARRRAAERESRAARPKTKSADQRDERRCQSLEPRHSRGRNSSGWRAASAARSASIGERPFIGRASRPISAWRSALGDESMSMTVTMISNRMALTSV